MKILLPLLLISGFLGACSQHPITSHPSTTFDCEILVKKQSQQLRKAMQQAKANHRRKPLKSKPKDQQVAIIAGDESHQKPASGSDKAFQEPAYSLSLVVGEQEMPVARTIFKNQLGNQKQDLIIPYPFIPIVGNDEASAIFEEFTIDTWIWPGLLFGAIVGMLALSVFKGQAKVVSRWAKDNKWKARSALVIMKIGTGVGCVLLGNDLYTTGVTIPEFVKIAALGVLASAFTFYPSKHFASGAPAFDYLERKFYDASIFAAGAIVMLYAGNHFDVTMQRADPVQTVAYVSVPADGIGGVHKKMSLVKKEFKQKLKTFLQEPPKERTSGGKTTLTILAVLAAVALTFGVASLSCSLSCSGSEVAAVFVFVGGVGLVVWGLVATIRAIHKRPTKKRPSSIEKAT